jgi:hypothetical protein
MDCDTIYNKFRGASCKIARIYRILELFFNGEILWTRSMAWGTGGAAVSMVDRGHRVYNARQRFASVRCSSARGHR